MAGLVLQLFGKWAGENSGPRQCRKTRLDSESQELA